MPISTPPLNPHPFPSNWGGGESAFTYCMVCGSSFSQCDGYDVGISHGHVQVTTSVQGPAPARIHGFMTDAAGCEPHRPSSRHWRRRLVQVLQQQYMFHRKSGPLLGGVLGVLKTPLISKCNFFDRFQFCFVAFATILLIFAFQLILIYVTTGDIPIRATWLVPTAYHL